MTNPEFYAQTIERLHARVQGLEADKARDQIVLRDLTARAEQLAAEVRQWRICVYQDENKPFDWKQDVCPHGRTPPIVCSDCYPLETDVKRPEHATAQSVTQAQTLRSDINIPCSCGPGDCNKRILAHNEYCTEDRRAFEVEEDLLLDRRVYGTSFHKIVNGKKVRVHPRDVRIINDMPKDSSNTECIASKIKGDQ